MAVVLELVLNKLEMAQNMHVAGLEGANFHCFSRVVNMCLPPYLYTVASQSDLREPCGIVKNIDLMVC